MPVNVDAPATASAIAAGRVVLGVAFALTPGLALRAWPGHGSHQSPAARFLARSTGVRDVALGLGTLLAVRKQSPVRGWLEAGMLADAGDALAVLLGMRSLPRGRALLALGAAAATAMAGQRLAGSLG